jgi:hypothetical protein
MASTIPTWGKEQLQEDLAAQLGGESVPLEIDQGGWDAVFRRTIEMYSRYKPLLRHENFKTGPGGVTVYKCLPDVIGVRDVQITPGIQPGLSSGLAIESMMLSGVPVYYGVGDTFIDIQYLDLRRRWIKAVSRELASDPDWALVVDPETLEHTIYTYGTGSLFVDVETYAPHNENLSSIPNYSHKWIADWARTEAMLIIGNARAKFDKIPVAGTFMSMNGLQMVRDAKDEQTKLLEWIQSSRADLFPRWA